MKKQDKVYWITVEDVQQAAMDAIDRKLTDEEMEKVVDRMGDYLNWYEAVAFAIADVGISEKNEEEA